MKKFTVLLTVLVAMAICVPHAEAAKRGKKGKQPVQVTLTPAGEKLKAEYTNQLNALKAQIEAAMPNINELKVTAYQKALEAEKSTKAALAAAQKNMGEIKKGQGLVGHAKGKWIGGANKGIAQTKEKLKKAKTQAERDALQKELVKWQKNLKDGQDALKERQAFLDAALANKPKWDRQLETAQKDLATAKTNVMKATKALGLESLLASSRLDAKLAKYQVMSEATPYGLAEYAQQGRAQKGLIDKLLADDDLMIQMAIAGGAKQGKYGKAMEIYTAIQNASSKAKSGVLQKLALGVSIEHAVPIGQRNAKAAVNAPATVNPVKRYQHYENAYLNNELDPAFKYLSVWDYRMVVNGEEPEEILTWGRKMLANYRPDQISKKDYRWRYVEAVRSDIKYGSQHNKYDQDDLQFFQNILKNGGVCGRRAFYGRFILRCFGIPTTARPQPGHATLVHWTPDGWVICLGAGWGHGTVRSPELLGRGRGEPDTIFLAKTQARMTGKPYAQVWRAKTLGTVFAQDDTSGFWDGVTLYRQRAIIEESKAKTLAAVGTDIGEANETKEKVDIIKTAITAADKKITVTCCGTITIPAAACSKPTKSTGKLIFMSSNLGGKQLHYSRTGGGDGIFEYTFDAPKAGKYALTARVVTPSWKQQLTVKANGKAVEMALPYTVGMWDKTQPVEITLAKGRNVLTFSRESDDFFRGLTIRDFTLTPVN